MTRRGEMTMDRAELTAKQRRKDIAHLASTTGLTAVEELSARYGVTASTIRRDLARLEGEGKLARTYGGAIYLSQEGESSLRERQSEAYSAKLRIARAASGLVGPGQHLFLDGGSTAGLFAHELRRQEGLTVTTIGLNTLRELSGAEGIDLYTPGGHLRPASQSFGGPLAETAMERLSFDLAFFGADGVVPDMGLCEAGHDQSRLKDMVARRASEVVVLADGSKIGARPFHSWTPLRTPWTLITDSSAPEEVVAGFERAGVRVIVAAED